MSKPVKQIHLAAHFPGVNNTTVWSDPASGSHIEFDSFVHFAQTAERGKFDFMFLAEDCGCANRAAGSTIWTSSAGRTPSPCWPHWPRSPTGSG
jgi:alkanesulfonate monooxygenase SsuD/methylene tetrahydromethanopterin reductase-like flavin-dependent oxidoreductase (luciferase family)